MHGGNIVSLKIVNPRTADSEAVQNGENARFFRSLYLAKN